MEMKLRTRCRLCDSTEIALATKFADMPRADGYTTDPTIKQPIYPCGLWACQSCGHAQIMQIVNPNELFGHYIYRSGDFPYVVEAFREFAYQTYARYQPKTVIEIGSNDGTMLGMFKAHGARVLGVDPSDVFCPHDTVKEFWGSKLANTLKYADDKQADLVLAFNSFAHCDDLMDYVDGVKTILAPNGVFIFEGSYLPDIVPGQFDKFDHEHLSYHSVGPLVPFFARHGLDLFDVTFNPSKGGSIRGYVQHIGGPHQKAGTVADVARKETVDGFRSLAPYKAMQARIDELTDKIHGFMDTHPGVAAGFGASSSSTPLIYDLKLQDRISFLVDDNESRHGLYSPGAHIPVRAPYAMALADYVLMLAWRYSENIARKHPKVAWVRVI